MSAAAAREPTPATVYAKTTCSGVSISICCSKEPPAGAVLMARCSWCGAAGADPYEAPQEADRAAVVSDAEPFVHAVDAADVAGAQRERQEAVDAVSYTHLRAHETDS